MRRRERVLKRVARVRLARRSEPPAASLVRAVESMLTDAHDRGGRAFASGERRRRGLEGIPPGHRGSVREGREAPRRYAAPSPRTPGARRSVRSRGDVSEKPLQRPAARIGHKLGERNDTFVRWCAKPLFTPRLRRSRRPNMCYRTECGKCGKPTWVSETRRHPSRRPRPDPRASGLDHVFHLVCAYLSPRDSPLSPRLRSPSGWLRPAHRAGAPRRAQGGPLRLPSRFVLHRELTREGARLSAPPRIPSGLTKHVFFFFASRRLTDERVPSRSARRCTSRTEHPGASTRGAEDVARVKPAPKTRHRAAGGTADDNDANRPSHPRTPTRTSGRLT